MEIWVIGSVVVQGQRVMKEGLRAGPRQMQEQGEGTGRSGGQLLR
jgi:hypothetical protein